MIRRILNWWRGPLTQEQAVASVQVEYSLGYAYRLLEGAGKLGPQSPFTVGYRDARNSRVNWQAVPKELRPYLRRFYD